MPLLIKATEAMPGQILAEDILNRTGNPLIRRGNTLTAPVLEKIVSRQITDYIRVILPGEDPTEAIWKELEDGGLPPTIVKRAKCEVQKVFNNILDESGTLYVKVKEMIDFITPVIRSLFDGDSPLFDKLQLLFDIDSYTYQHSWSVMLLSLSILRGAWDRGMIYPDDQTKEDVGIGAILRDLGMTAIPREILMKPGKLDPDEWEAITKHPEIGYEMVRKSSRLMPLAKAIIAHHHQFLDGSGYGAGELSPLKGKQIPDVVRLVTVADVYDALVAERPFRPANLPFQAMRILQSHSGTKFDGRFVHILDKIVVDYPIGSLLLFPKGLLGCVLQNFPKAKTNPKVLILASFSRKMGHFLDRTYRLEDPPVFFLGGHYILTGAATPTGLAQKIKTFTRSHSLDKIICPAEDRSLICLDEWKPTFSKELSFLFS